MSSTPSYAATIRALAELKTHDELRDNIAWAAQGVYSAANQLREKPLDHKNQTRLFDKIISFTNILNAWFVKEGFDADIIARNKEDEAWRTLEDWRKTVAQRNEIEADRIEIIAANLGEGAPDFGAIVKSMDITKTNTREEIQGRVAAKQKRFADIKARLANVEADAPPNATDPAMPLRTEIQTKTP